MSYEPDTILTLKEPRSKEDEPFPYDRVRVVGTSPVNHAGGSEQWVGANGQGVIIEPLAGFAANLDEPFGKLAELYSVESIPEHEIEVQKIIVRTQAQAGPSPEEVFSQASEDEGKDGGRKAVKRTPRRSPLGQDPRPAPKGSPLNE